MPADVVTAQTDQENHTLCPASLHDPDRLLFLLYVYVPPVSSHTTAVC